jgi:hypothetical protein
MHAHFVPNVECQFAGRVFLIDVYVADITDEMLLGLDFLGKHGARLDLKDSILWIDEIPVSFALVGNEVQCGAVQRVYANSDVTLLPCSASVIECFVGGTPSRNGTNLLVETSIQSAAALPMVVGPGPSLSLLIFNEGDEPISVRRGEEMGTATSIELENEPGGEACAGEPSVRRVSREAVLPEHLEKMFEQSSKALTADQTDVLRDLLIEYQDVFSVND